MADDTAMLCLLLTLLNDCEAEALDRWLNRPIDFVWRNNIVPCSATTTITVTTILLGFTVLVVALNRFNVSVVSLSRFPIKTYPPSMGWLIPVRSPLLEGVQIG